MRARSLRTRAYCAWRELAGRGVRSAYTAAELNRLVADWIAVPRTPDQEVRGDIRVLRARARFLTRNVGFAEAYMRLADVNILGPSGLTYQAKARDRAGKLDKDANDLIEAGFKDWAEGPVSADGQMNLREFEGLVLRTMLTDGECFVRMLVGPEFNRHGFALQAIDADLVDETYNVPRIGSRNEIVMGIELGDYNRRIGYHVWDSPADVTGISARRRYFVPASEMLHIYQPKRFHQTRGVTALHCGMQRLKIFDGYEEAELVAARIGAGTPFIVETQQGVVTEFDPSTDPINWEVGPGEPWKAPDGYTAKALDTKHPSTAYGLFISNVLRHVAAGWGVSYSGLTGDVTQATYSSMKVALGIERDGWRTLQNRWSGRFSRPVKNRWLETAILSGGLRLPSSYSRDFRLYLADTWNGRGWPWLEPLKELQAADISIGRGLGSRTKWLAEQGLDFEEILEDLKREKELAKKAGVSIDGVQRAVIQEPEEKVPAA